MSLKSLSLRWRMILIAVFLPLLFLMPVFLFVGQQFRTVYREVRLSKGEMLTSQLGQAVNSVTPYISSIYDVPDLESYLRESIADQPEMVFSALVLDTGFVVYHSLPGLGGTYVSELAYLDQEGLIKRVVRPYDEVYLVVQKFPLPGNEERFLYAVVAESVEMVEPPLISWSPVLIGLSVALILLVLIQLFSRRWILTPLSQLAEGAAIVGAGDLAYEIPMQSSDEFGFLARSFNTMARRLQGLVTSLEQQVSERTRDLEKKSRQLEAVAFVSREVANIRSVSLFLEATVTAISRQFEYYHTGIFLIDDKREWAVLQAASSEGGQRMLSRRHRLRVGQQGIVGTVALTAKAHIALDVGVDAVWFDNPDLPDTRSEIGLPLKDMEGQVIGVLDVQSAETQAFTTEDIETLQLLADQLSIVLRNARLFERTQSALSQLEDLQWSYSREGWARIMNQGRPRAYEYDSVSVQPVLPLPAPRILSDGTFPRQMVMADGAVALVEPMRYRDQTIGLVALSDPQRVWTAEERDLVQSVVDQVGIALENARLFEETQNTARQQALMSQVLQTTAMVRDPAVALREITGILARGLGMAVGIFTFPRPDATEVQLQAFVLPDGESLLPEGEFYPLPPDLQVFFQGLEEPELGKMLPVLGEISQGEAYNLKQVLYVAIRTAATREGFLVLLQRQDDVLLDPDTRSLARNLAGQVAMMLANMHLLEETQRRSTEMEALYDISLRFGKNLELEAIQNLLVSQAGNLLSADAGGFLVYHEHGDTLDFSATLGSIHAPRWRAKPGEGLVGQVFQQAKTIRIDDYAAWADHGEMAEEALDVQAALAVPLSVSWGVAGVLLGLREKGKPPFDQADVRLAELLAAQAAVALESARLYQESTKRARDLQQLYDAGLALISLLDVDKILDTGADWARRLFDGETATVFYWDEALGQYRAGRSLASPKWETTSTMPRPGGITHTIRETGKPVLIYDDRITSQNPAELIELGLISQIGVPIRLGRQIIGAFYVHSAEVGHFREEDLYLLEFLGTQLASAVQNAQLFGQTQAALGVVEMQVHYQTNVAQSTALLAERGTQALEEVLALLGDASHAGRVVYFETQEDAEEPYWSLASEWAAPGVGSKLENPLLQALRPQQFPEWVSEFKESGMAQTLLSSAPPVERQLLEALGIQSLLLAPVAGNHPTVPGFMGILDLEQEREWEKEVLVVMHTVGTALSSTLAREWLFKQVQDALTETEVLYKTGAALNTAQSYDDILAALCSQTILGQGAHDVTIEFYDRPWTETERPEWIEVLARWGQLPPEKARQRYHVDKTDIVLFSDRVGVVEDMLNDSRLDSRSRDFFFKSLGAKSAVFVPLLVGGQRIGTVIALYPEPTTVSEAEQRRLMNLAAQAAVAIQNRYQLQATAARARREQLAREIIGNIQSAADVQGVLQMAARELGRALRTPHTSIQVGGLGERRGRKLGTGVLTLKRDDSSPVVSSDE